MACGKQGGRSLHPWHLHQIKARLTCVPIHVKEWDLCHPPSSTIPTWGFVTRPSVLWALCLSLGLGRYVIAGLNTPPFRPLRPQTFASKSLSPRSSPLVSHFVPISPSFSSLATPCLSFTPSLLFPPHLGHTLPNLAPAGGAVCRVWSFVASNAQLQPGQHHVLDPLYRRRSLRFLENRLPPFTRLYDHLPPSRGALWVTHDRWLIHHGSPNL